MIELLSRTLSIDPSSAGTLVAALASLAVLVPAWVIYLRGWRRGSTVRETDPAGARRTLGVLSVGLLLGGLLASREGGNRPPWWAYVMGGIGWVVVMSSAVLGLAAPAPNEREEQDPTG